jgi:uncharacterized oxidoreductase
MQMTNNTILVTGGGSGIGLALAKRYVARGNRVIIAGRRAEALLAAKRDTPEFETLQCDVSSEAGRVALADQVRTHFPALNVLINNAGTAGTQPPLLQPQDWSAHRAELATNLDAPLHLTMLLLPNLIKAPFGAVVNVTSGLAFAPLAAAPIYCLSKSALHTFTLCLRHQLKDTTIDVVEIVPPLVNTTLGGRELPTIGVDVEVFSDSIFERLEKGENEIGYGTAEIRRLASRQELDAYFAQLNAPRT